jgi:hypothetical protein
VGEEVGRAVGHRLWAVGGKATIPRPAGKVACQGGRYGSVLYAGSSGGWPKEAHRDDEDEWAERCQMFGDPGGGSALRAASKRIPRNRPCPTCGFKNRLTPADVTRHYQCDACANAAEGGRLLTPAIRAGRSIGSAGVGERG